jgi:hypothetical protein
MTKTWPTSAVLSLTTGCLLGDFSEMHDLAEFLAGEPVYTHQLAHEAFAQELREGIYAQEPSLRDLDASKVTTANWKTYRDVWIRTFGETITLRPLGTLKTVGKSFTEPLKRVGSAKRDNGR